MAEATPCFQGYVQHASAQRLPSLSVLTLSCVSYSKRTDLVPRYRAFQATTLHDIAEQIARAEPFIKIVNAGDLNIPIPLSLQHGETDFAYLTRMLGAWGVPMATDDRTGRVLLGARGQEPPVSFPDADWGWSHLTFAGALQALPSLVPGGGSGAAGLAREALGQFLGQMNGRAAGYHFTPDQAQRSATHAQTASQTGTGRAEMHLDGAVLPFAPGHVVEVEGVPQLINAVSIRGRTNETTASQTFSLQQPTLPITAKPAPPAWMLHPVWAYVTDNANDPEQQGRVQVEFEVEPLDPQMSHERMWLHTLTPYGGGMGPGGARLLPTPHGPRAHAYAAGFYALPEVGERVLVQFLGQWDSDAVVLGAVRHGAVTPTDNARDTKRWRTPSGNEVAMTTQGEGAESKDTVDLHAQGKPVFQAVVDKEGESVSVQCGGSYVHLLNKGGEVRVEVFSGGAMLLHANGHLQIEGDSVQILAKGGKVSVRDTVMGGSGSGFVGRKVLNKNFVSGKNTQKPAPNACFECALKFLWPHEGGYSNDPDDHGGATNFGVTHKDYDGYRQWKKLGPGDVRNITKAEATELYHHKYWLGNHCDTMPPKLAIAHFDWSVLHGLAGAMGTLQQALGVSELKNAGTKHQYAFFGPQTKKALKEKLAQPNSEEALTDAYFDERERWCRQDAAKYPSQKKFLHGCLNRSADMRHYVKRLGKNCPGCQ